MKNNENFPDGKFRNRRKCRHKATPCLDMGAKPWRIEAVILLGAPPSTRELLKKFDQNF